MKNGIFVTLLSSFFIGCISPQSLKTSGEIESGYTYVPIDPFAVEVLTSRGTNAAITQGFYSNELLQRLPDNAVRISAEQINTSAKAGYGPVGIAGKGEAYRITVDYINSDTTNFRVLIRMTALTKEGKEIDVSPFESSNGKYIIGTEAYRVLSEPSFNMLKDGEYTNYVAYSLPVYIGVGLRVIANVKVLEGKINISGLGRIGAEAEANKLTGSLVVQTLGINGKSIAAALPIQSELNRTTAQNAVVAVGAIKALLYENETVVIPRVVGLYLPFRGDKQLVNAIISELSKHPILWEGARRSPVSSISINSRP